MAAAAGALLAAFLLPARPRAEGADPRPDTSARPGESLLDKPAR